MDWTLEDEMVDDLFFCAAITGSSRDHSPFVQAGAETSDTSADVVKVGPARCAWEGHSGWVGAAF